MNIIESLNKYSSGFFRWFYGDTAVSDMESYRRGKVFLQKYALDDDTFRKECAPVMQEVFRLNEKRGFNLQEMSVAELFQRIIYLGIGHNIEKHVIPKIE